RGGAHPAVHDGAPGEDAPRHHVRLGAAEYRLPASGRSLSRRPPEDRPAGEPALQAQRDERGIPGAAERPGGARGRRLLSQGTKDRVPGESAHDHSVGLSDRAPCVPPKASREIDMAELYHQVWITAASTPGDGGSAPEGGARAR